MKTKASELLSSKEGIWKICVYRNGVGFASLKRSNVYLVRKY